MNLAAFEHLLKQKMGLDAASIGSSAVERAVGARAAACGVPSAAAYYDLLQANPSEVQELIETVVIPETWFFRDREAFAAMAAMAGERLIEGRGRTLRLLSVPCATGEEPYSMAIALLDKGVSSHLFAIDAVDISRRSLALAAHGVYGKNSFRGRDLAFRDRHFARDGQRYRLSDAARARVSFEQANLFDPMFKSRALYDVIFCRNLLIYFDAATQAEAVRILSGLLRPDGALFVGPSEASLLLSLQFQPARIPLAFAFFKGTTPAVRATVSPRPISPRPVRPPPAPPRAAPPSPLPDRVPDPPAVPAPSALAEVHRLAEQGHLVEAARLCQDYLKGKAASAEAVFLLGVIRDAAGNLDEAADLYRKAIYLNPADDLALAHLALVLERNGDAAGAEAANDRLRRFERRGRG